MLVDFYVCEDIDFVDGAFLEFLILSKFIYGNDLYGIFFLIVVIDSAVYFSVNSGTYRLIQCVVFYVFDHDLVVMNKSGCYYYF